MATFYWSIEKAEEKFKQQLALQGEMNNYYIKQIKMKLIP